MHRIYLTDESEAELDEAVRFYESRKVGLGLDFANLIEDAFLFIQSNPDRWPIYKDQVRIFLVRRFPFKIYYRIESIDLIVVFAIAHASRRPGYWKDQLSNG